jgi:hypothetical protein
VRIDAAGAGPGWAVWDHPRDVASVVSAVPAIKLRRDIVIASPPSARPHEAHDRENAAVAQKTYCIFLYVFNPWHGNLVLNAFAEFSMP